MENWLYHPFIVSAWSGNLRQHGYAHTVGIKETASLSYWPRVCLYQSSKVFQDQRMLPTQSCIIILTFGPLEKLKEKAGNTQN